MKKEPELHKELHKIKSKELRLKKVADAKIIKRLEKDIVKAMYHNHECILLPEYAENNRAILKEINDSGYRVVCYKDDTFILWGNFAHFPYDQKIRYIKDKFYYNENKIVKHNNKKEQLIFAAGIAIFVIVLAIYELI